MGTNSLLTSIFVYTYNIPNPKTFPEKPIQDFVLLKDPNSCVEEGQFPIFVVILFPLQAIGMPFRMESGSSNMYRPDTSPITVLAARPSRRHPGRSMLSAVRFAAWARTRNYYWMA
ncbi:hypothetical protein AAC387_Pa07g3860 [Persea americana]